VKKELPGDKHCGSILIMSEASLGEFSMISQLPWLTQALKANSSLSIVLFLN
jgi:hypothetical protein